MNHKCIWKDTGHMCNWQLSIYLLLKPLCFGFVAEIETRLPSIESCPMLEVTGHVLCHSCRKRPCSTRMYMNNTLKHTYEHSCLHVWNHAAFHLLA